MEVILHRQYETYTQQPLKTTKFSLKKGGGVLNSWGNPPT